MTNQQSPNLVEQKPSQNGAPMFNLPPITVGIIAVLVLIHGGLAFGGEQFQIWSQAVFAFNPARFGIEPINQLAGSAYWSMLTYGLLHADWMHLSFNSLWLVIFSKPVVLRLGTLKLLILLAASIVAGALASLVVHWGEFLVMVGISAGVSGVMAAAIPIIYARGGHWGMTSPAHMALVHPLTPVGIITDKTAAGFTLVWLALTTFTATTQYFTGTAFLEERVIAWEAHLGGFIMGFIMFYLLDRKTKRDSLTTQK